MHDLRHTKSTVDELRHFHSVRCSNFHQPSVTFAEYKFSTDPRICRFPHSFTSVQMPTHSSWMLTSSTDSVVADKNRDYTSIHHVSRADQNCAVLKRAENIMRHVEMWSAVRQKGTVRASRKTCSGLKGPVTKSYKFISRVKHHKQRKMFASPLGCGLPDQSRLTFTLSGSGLITFACKNLMAGAAHVSMSDDTDTGKLW